MPFTPPRLCRCGNVIPAGERCACQKTSDRARKARHDRRRPSARQRGYNTEWQKARAAYLIAHPYCALCGNPASHVDHINPHRGDDALFWDRANWQALCAHCHNSTKQRVERRPVQS